MKTGIELIKEERQRQIDKEGWTPSHDDTHTDEEMAEAASIYAQSPRWRKLDTEGTPTCWPWLAQWWKPTPKDRIRELAKAGALIAAEIDRLNRATTPPREYREAFPSLGQMAAQRQEQLRDELAAEFEPCKHKQHRAFGKRHRECTDCGHIWEPDDEDEPEKDQP